MNRTLAFVLRFKLFMAILFLSICMSCNDQEPTQLSFDQKRLVDSISRVHMNAMDSILEKECDMRFDSLVRVNFDSLLNRRIYEIQKLEKSN